MYEFIDTTEAGGSSGRPAEALRLNGIYIEDVIPGYRTLYAAGREALAPNLELLEVGSRDGAILTRSRYPERVIRVGYQLLASSPEDFREAFNKLGGLLAASEAQLIFEDEPDKYFTGTASAIGDVEPGRCSVKGEIEFTCSDPFKYSLEMTEAEPEADGSFAITYTGTYKSYPELVASFYKETDISADGSSDTTLTGAGDCGFVSWFNQDEKVIFLGDDERDGDSFPKSQTLISNDFQQSTAWGTAAKNKWAVNNVTIQGQDNHTRSGTISVKHNYPTTKEGSYYLTANTYGSGSTFYYGPSVTRTIPADESGAVGAQDFTMTCRLRMCIGSEKTAANQKGCFQVMLTDSAGLIVAGVRVLKNANGNKGRVDLLMNGGVPKKFEIDLSYYNPYFGQDKGSQKSKKAITITKSGAKVTFNVAGLAASFTCPAIETAVVKKATVHFEQTKHQVPLSYMGISVFKFVKNNCTVWRNIPNKFSAGDEVVADCRSAEVYLNGVQAPELGALGNDWEDFCLTPGVNQIGTAYSEWVTAQYAPSFKVRYREVFL